LKIKEKLNLVFAKKNPHRFWTIFGQKLEKKVIFPIFSKSAKTPVLACFDTFLLSKHDKIKFSGTVR